MPTSPAQIDSLAGRLADIVGKGKATSYAGRIELIDIAECIAIAAREPEENLYAAATRNASNAAIRSAIALGALETVPLEGGSATAQDIAKAAGADVDLVVRILRACVASHVFDEVAECTYAHNDYSRCFAVRENRDMFSQMYDFVGRGTYAIPEYISTHRFRNADSYDDSAFHLGCHTDLGFWEYLQADPARMRLFNSGMRSTATVASALGSSVYPFAAELNAPMPCTEEQVVLVDIGGGRGQALERIRAEFPELAGRLILQDQPHVVEDARRQGLAPEIETQGLSFFDANPVKGARAYHFRRIFHDWGHTASVCILKNVAAVMGTESRVLISDTLVPTRNAPWRIALQDINMMAFSGMERTEKQWHTLLTDAGLALKKIWAVEGSMHVTIEAILKAA